jgi:hypothetical protein
MLAVLQFLFQDLWHWLGGLFYLALVVAGASNLIRIVRIDRSSPRK